MPIEQSSPRPAVLILVPAIIRAVFELARARRQFGRLTAHGITERNAYFEAASAGGAEVGSRRITDLIPRLFPRLAKLLPWRADCLVQAIAAQNWLGSMGQASAIVLGAKNTESQGFGAHAWLICGDKVITGGDIAPYTAFLGESPQM